jgi:NTP pyrophosphatase (non-canonical NTP hydrolase)
MTFKEYQSNAKRTCADLGSLEMNLSHMILGIISEQEEFLKAIVNHDKINIIEESADVLWYIANYCTFRNFDLEDIYNNRNDVVIEAWETEVTPYEIHASKLADYVKKFIAYKKPLDPNNEINSLRMIIDIICSDIEEVGGDVYSALQNNIDKLKVRFPDKFSEHSALNRNIEEERKELEK